MPISEKILPENAPRPEGVKMSNRNGSIIDDLALLPWWVNVILALAVYLSMKYWIPTIRFQNTFYAGMAQGAPAFAPASAIVLLCPAVLSVFNVWRKARLLDRQKGIDSIRLITWQEFEKLVSEAYRRQGYRVTENGGGGADGGIDLILRKNGEKLLLQCKHWKLDKIGVKVVRELYGVVAAEGASGGIVISSGSFTREAQDFARGKPMELIEGTALARMVEEVKKTPSPSPASASITPALLPANPKTPAQPCPLCGGELVLRSVKKGPRAGEKFWGCAAFPKCRGSKAFTE